MLLPCVNHYQTAQNSKPQNPSWRGVGRQMRKISQADVVTLEDHIVVWRLILRSWGSPFHHCPRSTFFSDGARQCEENLFSNKCHVCGIRCLRSKDEISGDIPPSSVAWYGFGKSCGSWVYVYASYAVMSTGCPCLTGFWNPNPKSWLDMTTISDPITGRPFSDRFRSSPFGFPRPPPTAPWSAQKMLGAIVAAAEGAFSLGPPTPRDKFG